MSKPRIAHITTIDASLNALLLNQLRSISQAGYEVVGISSPGPYVRTIEAAGIRHIAVPMERSIAPLADLTSLHQLYQVLRREQFVLVHTHNPKPGLIGQLAARMARVPIVVNTLHGFYFHDHMSPASRRFYITLERIAARCSDVILSQNSEDIQTAISEGICSPDLVKHLGNGIDLSRFDPDSIPLATREQARIALGIPEGARVVGFVGRLTARRKGFLDFLAAGQRLAQRLPDLHLLIVGDAAEGESDTVKPSAAHEYGIADRCHFTGWRPNTELPTFYRLMDVLVLPSLFEGIPRAVMEASAMGVPVVATDVKGNREAVLHNRSGLLVPLADVDALSASIGELLTNPERARSLGDEGRRLALRRFDEQLVFDKVKREYARLLHQKGLPQPALQPEVAGRGTSPSPQRGA